MAANQRKPSGVCAIRHILRSTPSSTVQWISLCCRKPNRIAGPSAAEAVLAFLGEVADPRRAVNEQQVNIPGVRPRLRNQIGSGASEFEACDSGSNDRNSRMRVAVINPFHFKMRRSLKNWLLELKTASARVDNLPGTSRELTAFYLAERSDVAGLVNTTTATRLHRNLPRLTNAWLFSG
ncbi:hypothetical protein [Flavisphingomonas formosensis]|uniref:hypothetical protein n=1 Tax=Flavisphingomonas formosensis TaxID=861534 RepID=UPI0012F7B798|nr:hypothetical protein [Sphingomonas formosensis]